ncbi:MAG: ribonuclease J [Firmicutes bacterium]|nr:ribonuclease J [Bacillota bacterium]
MKIQVIPLGGLGEVGKNMTVIRYQDDIVVVDAGLAFPEEELLGIDIVIPDFSYLLENRDKVRGLLLTHGHEDHIGAVSYVLKQLDIPVFGTPLTLGLVEGKLAEHGLVMPEGSRAVKPGESIQVAAFTVDFVRVNHSIPDAVSLALHCPVGTIVHTGDFKFDHTPVDGQPADFHKFAELGNQGVLVLLADSTNAERPGFTPSERVVGAALDDIISKAEGRVLVATFASNVHRMQQVIDSAYKFGRKVAVVGRSMENTVAVAQGLGYLQVAEGTLVDVEELGRFPVNQIVILTTGSQGEPMSALTRMSVSDHKRVEIIPGDTVLIAATPVPGNEKMVSRTINNLYKRGATVIHPPKMLVHVSGHASQEEQKLMINLVRPKFFVPVHGEQRMLVHHAQLAEATGVPRPNILIGENGTVFEFSRDSAAISGKVTAGQTLVDGLGVGDVGNIVLRDRKQLSQDGIVIVVVAMDRNSGLTVSGPDVVTRGFVYVRESEQLMDETKAKVREALDDCEERRITEWSTIKSNVRDALGKFLYDRTRRRPMILPIILEV